MDAPVFQEESFRDCDNFHTAPGHNLCFTRKLFDILSDEKNQHIISWHLDGESFEVYDPKLLERDVLPQYFRHARFQSLVRQLNFYSFKKVGKERSSWIYSHSCFKRGQPELLLSLKRKTNSGGNQHYVHHLNIPLAQIQRIKGVANGNAAQLSLPSPYDLVLAQQPMHVSAPVHVHCVALPQREAATVAPAMLTILTPQTAAAATFARREVKYCTLEDIHQRQLQETASYLPLSSLQCRGDEKAAHKVRRDCDPSQLSGFISSHVMTTDPRTPSPSSRMTCHSDDSISSHGHDDGETSSSDHSDGEYEARAGPQELQQLARCFTGFVAQTGISMASIDKLLALLRPATSVVLSSNTDLFAFCCQVLQFLREREDFAFELLVYMQMLQYPVESIDVGGLSMPSLGASHGRCGGPAMDLVSYLVPFSINVLETLHDGVVTALADGHGHGSPDCTVGVRVFLLELRHIAARLARLSEPLALMVLPK